jgi:hypothetical protein
VWVRRHHLLPLASGACDLSLCAFRTCAKHVVGGCGPTCQALVTSAPGSELLAQRPAPGLIVLSGGRNAVDGSKALAPGPASAQPNGQVTLTTLGRELVVAPRAGLQSPRLARFADLACCGSDKELF